MKMLNDLFNFESKLSVDEVEDEIREDQNSNFIQGKAVHTFEEMTNILDYMPAGYEADEEAPVKGLEDENDDLPELDEAEEEKLKNDESLKWDETEPKDGEEKDKDKKKAGTDDDEDEDGDDDEDDDEEEEDEDGEKKPKRKIKGKR